MLTEPAPAKLNLALHVRARGPDGYHDLETLFAFCRDGDLLTLDDGPLALAITGPFAAGLETDDTNLVLRAALAFAATFGTEPTGSFVLTKNLPVASGIGGGSADAAAALRLLARRDGIACDDPRLFACAGTLGSDVPACLLGRTAIGRGRGERLEPTVPLTGYPVLLVNPGIALSTAAVFKQWDGYDRGPIPAVDPLTGVGAGFNSLYPAARRLAPVIGAVMKWLDAVPGSSFVQMSGSGATCFAIFQTSEQVAQAAAAGRRECPGWWTLATELA